MSLTLRPAQTLSATTLLQSGNSLALTLTAGLTLGAMTLTSASGAGTLNFQSALNVSPLVLTKAAPAGRITFNNQPPEVSIRLAQFFQGPPGAGGGGGSAFLDVPDEIDDTGAIHFYFGWVSVEGNWLVQRQARATAQTLRADITANPSHPDLASAWAARASLNYA